MDLTGCMFIYIFILYIDIFYIITCIYNNNKEEEVINIKGCGEHGKKLNSREGGV